MQKIIEALEKVDYTPCGQMDKIYVNVPFEGGRLIAYINRHTSDVLALFPMHNNWTTSLVQIAYEKDNRGESCSTQNI